MRKLTYVTALIVLLLTGCSRKEGIMENKGELVTLNYNVSLVDGVQSRNGENSTVAANRLACAVYEMTIGENGEKYFSWKKTEFAIKNDNQSFTYSPQLFNNVNYKIVFWAYYQGGDLQNPTVCYDLSDFSAIKANDNYTTVGNAEREAFTSTDEIINGVSRKEGLVVLSRPYSQVNVLSTKNDYNNAVNLGKRPTACEITLVGFSNTYNALKGEWVENATSTHIVLSSSIPDYSNSTEETVPYASEYVFGYGTGICVVQIKAGNEVIYNPVGEGIPSFPLGINQRINLSNGNLLTGGSVNYTITVSPNF